jgi:hypothetical protein
MSACLGGTQSSPDGRKREIAARMSATTANTPSISAASRRGAVLSATMSSSKRTPYRGTSPSTARIAVRTAEVMLAGSSRCAQYQGGEADRVRLAPLRCFPCLRVFASRGYCGGTKTNHQDSKTRRNARKPHPPLLMVIFPLIVSIRIRCFPPPETPVP